jgi:DNA-binding LytR/AlgR family response regulator
VNVFLLDEEKPKSVLLRSTLKKMEEQLTGHEDFFRCHRMYIVNLAQVTEVSGNAQGLRLHLAGLKEPVPVSRSLTETVKEKLHHRSHSPQNV